MLPDLDESVSFVVDKGSPVGPIPMRSIIDSIRSGDRAPDVLVWWAGATDWVVFSNDAGLLELLQALPATNQPPPPPPVSPDDEAVPVEVAQAESRFPEPEVQSFDVSFGDGDQAESSAELEASIYFEEAATELEEAELELKKAELELDDVLEGYPVQVDDQIAAQANPADNDVLEPFFDPAAEAEADAMLSGDPRSMHPSASWGDNETTVIDYSSIAEEMSLADDAEGAEETAPVEEAEEAVHESVLETRAIDIEEFQKVLGEQQESAESAEEAELTEASEQVDVSDAIDEADQSEIVEETAFVEQHESIEQSALATSAIDPAMLDELVSEEVVVENEASLEESAHDDREADSEEDAPATEDVHAAEGGDDESGDIDESELESAPDELSTGLTGLFGKPGRVDVGDSDAAATEQVVDDDAIGSSLETVGARIDALTSATRRAQQGGALVMDDEDQEAVSTVAAELADGSDTAGEQSLLDEDTDEVAEADGFVFAHAAEATTESDTETEHEVQQSSGSWQAVEGPGLEDRFSEMVRLSVVHQRRLDWALRPDELLLSSCITAIVERGYVLLDVENHEVSQRAIFDHNDDSRHIRLELSPLSPVNAAGDPVGRHVQVRVAWGREVQDADEAFATVRAHATDEVTDPGTILCEANMVASSATTSVDLIWAAQDFLRDDHSVDRASLDASIIAILHALEARWHELFTAS